jgi:2-hydroxy-6-oxonona-2,4-dienedioate hydrolase
VLVAGDPGDPVVVCVHGAVISSRYFEPLMSELASSFRVLAPDLPGYGRSAEPAGILDVARLGEWLTDFRSAAGFDRAIWVGNSLGCQILTQLAVRSPESVAALVFVGPTVDPSARSAVGQLWRLVRDAPREKVSLLLAWTADLFAAGLTRAFRTLPVALDDRIEERLPSIEAPLLVVRGADDPVVPEEWAERTARAGKLVVIDGAAHAAHYSHPREVAAALRDFLAGLGITGARAPSPPRGR